MRNFFVIAQDTDGEFSAAGPYTFEAAKTERDDQRAAGATAAITRAASWTEALDRARGAFRICASHPTDGRVPVEGVSHALDLGFSIADAAELATPTNGARRAA